MMKTLISYQIKAEKIAVFCKPKMGLQAPPAPQIKTWLFLGPLLKTFWGLFNYLFFYSFIVCCNPPQRPWASFLGPFLKIPKTIWGSIWIGACMGWKPSNPYILLSNLACGRPSHPESFQDDSSSIPNNSFGWEPATFQ